MVVLKLPLAGKRPMAKLVYIGFPSPLNSAKCKNLEDDSEVEVTQVSRGICQVTIVT